MARCAIRKALQGRWDLNKKEKANVGNESDWINVRWWQSSKATAVQQVELSAAADDRGERAQGQVRTAGSMAVQNLRSRRPSPRQRSLCSVAVGVLDTTTDEM